MARVNDILSALLGTGIFDVYLTGRRWGYWPCWADWLVVIGCLIASILWSRRLPAVVSAAITLAAVGGVLAVGAFSGWDVTLIASTTAAVVCLLLGYLAGGFFVNFMNATSPQSVGESVGRLNSGGTIPLFNLAILVKVAGGLAGVFLALAAFRAGGRPHDADAPAGALPGGAGEKEV